MLFDIVIPVGPNDKNIIETQIKYTKQNIIGYRNIYLICYDPSFDVEGCIMIHENIFPFTMEYIQNTHGKRTRNGWYLQQLLKIYAGRTIPHILGKYLVIDCDTFFLKPTSFIENGKCLYNFGTEYHADYFAHMQKLDKDFTKVYHNMSGICHHMMFETKYVDEIINKIEKKHNDMFYKVFLRSVSQNNYDRSGASEYEMYFNYVFKNHNDKVKLRRLKWKNTKTFFGNEDFEYVSCHWYIR